MPTVFNIHGRVESVCGSAMLLHSWWEARGLACRINLSRMLIVAPAAFAYKQ